MKKKPKKDAPKTEKRTKPNDIKKLDPSDMEKKVVKSKEEIQSIVNRL